MKPALTWIFAVVITILAVIFQRDTGPTKPAHIAISASGTVVQGVLTCPRSLTRNSGADTSTIDIKADGIALAQLADVALWYRRIPSSDSLLAVTPQVELVDGLLRIKAQIPTQPAAGKVGYSVVLIFSDGSTFRSDEVVLRFRNSVPAGVIIPHILFMYMALLFAVVTGLSVFGRLSSRRYATATLAAFCIGGFILGPLLQHYAFGVYWAGWPLGGDLTDNKTLFAFMVWLLAWAPNMFGRFRALRYAKYLYLLAALVTLVAFSIPHSTNGSQYDYKTQQVTSANS